MLSNTFGKTFSEMIKQLIYYTPYAPVMGSLKMAIFGVAKVKIIKSAAMAIRALRDKNGMWQASATFSYSRVS